MDMNIRIAAKQFYYHYYRFKSPRVLGRVACLGKGVLSQLGLLNGLANHQKNRVDFILERKDNRGLADNLRQFQSNIIRADIKSIVEQQTFDFLSYSLPRYIFMDSFSELTDQLFKGRTIAGKFLANYSDLRHTDIFGRDYECLGLLPINELSIYYEGFFETLSKTYPSVPVIFINFPAKFETRETFLLRAEIIRETLEGISRQYKNVYTINAADRFVMKAKDEPEELKDFPYHYSISTFKHIASLVEKHIN